MSYTSERLQLYNFSPEVTERVAEVAEVQQSFDNHIAYFAHLGVTAPRLFRGHSILDIKPTSDSNYDEQKARVYHYPMGNPNDSNMLYQASTLFAADPNVRLIGAGNASGPGFPGGALDRRDRKKVAHGDLRPTVEPLLDYLEQEGITDVEHVGYSFGATKAAVAAKYSGNYDQNATASVHIEPADVTKRGILELGYAFQSTAEVLDEYVNVNKLPSFEEARRVSIGGLMYNLGIMRPTNLAITRYLMKGLFEYNLTEALQAQEGLVASVIWGGESELALDGLVADIVARTRAKSGDERLKSMRLRGMRHAFPNDLHLQAAVVLETLGIAA